MSSTVPEPAGAAAPPGRAPAGAATHPSHDGQNFPWLPPTWTIALGLVAVSVNLRLGLAGVPPLADLITSELHLSNAAIGVLTTLPVLCMGIFAPVAHWASSRYGSAPTVFVALVITSLGSVLRIWGSNVVVLYVATLVLGVGIAIVGTLLPRLVKTIFAPERVGAVTGIYMLALMLGATLSAGLSVPLAKILGSWEASLASWAAIGLVGLVAWAPLTRVVWRHRVEVTARSIGTRLPWRHLTAWLVAAYLVSQSWAFYSTLAWLVPTYIGVGWDREHAGYLLSVFSGVQIVAGLLMPVISDRVRDLRWLLVPTTLAAGLGLLGIAVAPDANAFAPWGWAVLVGFGQGSAFALALVLLVRSAATPHASGGLSAMGFLVGYGLSSFGPLTMGAIRDVTGGFHTVWVVLAALMTVQLGIAMTLRPGMRRVT